MLARAAQLACGLGLWLGSWGLIMAWGAQW
jgi:hypothetical protein